MHRICNRGGCCKAILNPYGREFVHHTVLLAYISQEEEEALEPTDHYRPFKIHKRCKKLFGSPISDILESWPKTNWKKALSSRSKKNNSKLENLKIVKYLCCTICFQIDTQCIRYCLLHTMLQSTSTWQTSIDDSSFGGGGVAYSGGWIYCWNLQDEWPTWAQFAVNIINHIGHRVIQKHLVVLMVWFT